MTVRTEVKLSEHCTKDWNLLNFNNTLYTIVMD